MPVVFILVTIAVLGGVFFAATGRGGEISAEQPDHAPLDLGQVSAPDIALLRPPTALWGYNMQVTDEALDHIAQAVRDRDNTIAYLQQQLARRDIEDPVTHPDPLASPPPLTSASPLVPQPSRTYPVTPASPPPLGTTPPLGSPVPPFSPVSSPAEPLQARRISKPPGFLVAPLPRKAPPPAEFGPPAEFTQPADVTQPREATQPVETAQAGELGQSAEITQAADVTQPSEVAQLGEAAQPGEAARAADSAQLAEAAPPTSPAPDSPAPDSPAPASAAEVPIPQVLYDAHGWWAQQEAAEREEALRQAQARADTQARADAQTPAEGQVQASGGEPDLPEDTGPAGATPAQRDDDLASGRAVTRSNPAIGSLPSPPDDDALAWAEKQSRR